MSKSMQRIEIPEYYPQQRTISESTKLRVIVDAGRQAGKTTLVAIKSLDDASVGKKVLYTAPIGAQTDTYWEYCVTWLSPAIEYGTVKKNETKRTLTFKDGGVITARTAWKPDHLRGIGEIDLLILDEYAYQDPIMWDKVCQPMLLSTNGRAWLISTPDLRNHFYHLYLKAQEDPRWDTFTFSSLDNPHLSKEALDFMIEGMSEDNYKQEILALFIEGLGQVFSFNLDDFIPHDGDTHEGHRRVAGLDWGQTDNSALSIGCADCSKEILIARFKGPYPAQRDEIKDLLPENVELLAESNSIGQPNIEQLREDGVEVEGFAMTSTSKPQVVQTMKLSLSRREWKWLDDPTALRELESYEMKRSPSGSYTYSAPSGLHDDCNVARMLMLRQATFGTHTLV